MNYTSTYISVCLVCTVLVSCTAQRFQRLVHCSSSTSTVLTSQLLVTYINYGTLQTLWSYVLIIISLQTWIYITYHSNVYSIVLQTTTLDKVLVYLQPITSLVDGMITLLDGVVNSLLFSSLLSLLFFFFYSSPPSFPISSLPPHKGQGSMHHLDLGTRRDVLSRDYETRRPGKKSGRLETKRQMSRDISRLLWKVSVHR